MQPPADRLVRAYRARLEAIHALVARQIEALYGEVDPDAIAASFEAFIARAAPVIEAGQASTAALAAAFLRTYTFGRTGHLLDFEDDEPIVGTRPDGTPIAAGMAAFAAMVLGRIRDGAAVEEAMAFGGYLATRYADGELISATDRTVDAVTRRSRFTSWEGFVQQGSCEPCLANAGVHPIEEEPYRHPGCNCDVIPLLDVS